VSNFKVLNVQIGYSCIICRWYAPTKKVTKGSRWARTSPRSGPPVLVAAMLEFRLPVWPHSIETTSIELLDLENIGVAVGISFLSHLQAEILGGGN
jgi:hypothetical protein